MIHGDLKPDNIVVRWTRRSGDDNFTSVWTGKIDTEGLVDMPPVSDSEPMQATGASDGERENELKLPGACLRASVPPCLRASVPPSLRPSDPPSLHAPSSVSADCATDRVSDEHAVLTPRRHDGVASGGSGAGTTPDSNPRGFTPSSDDSSPEAVSRVASSAPRLDAEARRLPTVALRSYTRSFLFNREKPVGTVASDLFALGRSVKNLLPVSSAAPVCRGVRVEVGTLAADSLL